MGAPQAHQGRGEASADPEPRGATDRGSSPQRAQGSNGRTLGDQSPDAGAQSATRISAPSGGGGDGDAPEPPAKAKPSGPTGPGSRMALRNWRISTRLVSLLALPVVAATTLGALRIEGSLDNIKQLDQMKLLTEMTQQATQLASALQEERDKSAGPLAGKGNEKDDRVVSTREDTNRSIAAFREATHQIDPGDQSLAGVQSTLVNIDRQLGKINEVRDTAYDNSQYYSLTVQNYNELINSLLSLSQDMAQATSNRAMINNTRALATFSSAKEYASIQRALISAALADPKGADFSANDRRFARTAVDKENEALGRFKQIRQGNSEDLLEPLDSRPDIKAATMYADRAVRDPEGLKAEKRTDLDWYDQDSIKIEEMGKIEETLLSEMQQKARELRDSAQQDAILNGALILLVLGVSLVGAFVVARSMVRSLRRLQDTAQEVSQKRLPELVKQLSESDPQDVDTSVESVGVHSRDEIGKVAAAFDDVHREAVRLAAEQALLRGNVNAMFTNLSRRSQGLIQRQLSLISELESREADPDQLSSLFKLDHLATRMRRNGENLLVLAGEEPGRRWTRPVPLVDVLRAAASEVEQYERIELSSVPATEVAGRVVNDLVHLLAELLENATSFSSPQTKVKVTGHALPDGRVLVEIHDTGIGLSPEDLAAINERLASPPTVDVSVSRRMGLFVVGRLSLRHGIRIQLRPSDSGGTTALVMLPVDVAQGGRKPAPQAAGGQGGPGAGNGDAQGGGAGLLGSAPSRRQVPGSGSRAALPGNGGGSGLPTRPVGAGAGPSGGAPAGSTNFFEGGRPPGPRTNAPSGPGGQQGGPGAPSGRPPLPTRGENPTVAPPTGAPARADGGDQGGRPQLSTRGPAPELPAPAQPGTSWGARRASGEDDWPGTPRDAGDTPRGHEEYEPTGQFARPEFGGPSDRRDPFGNRGPGDTGELPQLTDGPSMFEPRRAPSGPQAGQGLSDSGQFNRPDYGRGPGDTGEFARPELGQGPGDTGEYAQPRFEDTAPRGGRGPGDTGEFPRPNMGGPGDTGEFPRPNAGGPGDTGEFPRPDMSGTGEYALPQDSRGGEPERRTNDPLPPAPGPGDGRTPIFDTIESTWHHHQVVEPGNSGPRDGGRSYPSAPSAPSAPEPTPGRPASAVPPPAPREPQPASQGMGDFAGSGASAGPGGAGLNGRSTGSHWRTSPHNDERWRRAEQIREPAAGGITSSGLPRRVPRANLVEGAAHQQPQQPERTGPQVSRAPDDVRGRLTNLRRGIQQGRRAGTGLGDNHDRGIGPTYQQER
ncbi:nitrate- and nitrite sensing domain-containing protein [Streptomyces rapamycinicus]|uniref:histidine kinase n=2 Tax=Streptomyces rapamycinicus TaxID=1226757 RepID=A0A3L8RRP3_STRRN|nr:nitrate- and nitrite sensing domain-containing protein [Streptomyces rapamycinicus]MBB4782298.1 signal transduction histidine kinase [Streptomyces rapamycinicus]RLV82218.1 histidine kinase [Streptomyces rapamycinicus NRRL 5491]UTO62823.1 nitrate- and nitrite sensing domain-containing protein [Streptomyces rapamycinicus]UTP30781.1 nitrate- and nitrite sensing domain-containing protein [Streptomyces rapamycinicus NRRL 5491]